MKRAVQFRAVCIKFLSVYLFPVSYFTFLDIFHSTCEWLFFCAARLLEIGLVHFSNQLDCFLLAIGAEKVLRLHFLRFNFRIVFHVTSAFREINCHVFSPYFMVDMWFFKLYHNMSIVYHLCKILL